MKHAISQAIPVVQVCKPLGKLLHWTDFLFHLSKPASCSACAKRTHDLIKSNLFWKNYPCLRAKKELRHLTVNRGWPVRSKLVLNARFEHIVGLYFGLYDAPRVLAWRIFVSPIQGRCVGAPSQPVSQNKFPFFTWRDFINPTFQNHLKPYKRLGRERPECCPPFQCGWINQGLDRKFPPKCPVP